MFPVRLPGNKVSIRMPARKQAQASASHRMTLMLSWCSVPGTASRAGFTPAINMPCQILYSPTGARFYVIHPHKYWPDSVHTSAYELLITY